MIRLGILGSTRGTAMLALVDAIAQKNLVAKIELVVSNKADAMILSRAKAHHLPNQWIESKLLTRELYDQKLSDLFKEKKVDLIVLIGYMRIISNVFLKDWKNKIINTHPSLLPAHAGKMDLDVHRSVIKAKEKKSGCTVHFVTEAVDGGPIVLQKVCEVNEDDTPESLKKRVQTLEGITLVKAIQTIMLNNSQLLKS